MSPNLDFKTVLKYGDSVVEIRPDRPRRAVNGLLKQFDDQPNYLKDQSEFVKFGALVLVLFVLLSVKS